MQQYNFKVSRHLNFSHTIQALIPFHSSNYLKTTPNHPVSDAHKTLHTHPISAHPVQNVLSYIFLPIFPIKNKNQSSMIDTCEKKQK